MTLTRKGAVALSALLLTACATAAPLTTDFKAPDASAKVLLMPVDAEVYFVKLGATDLRADWTDQAIENFDASLREHLSGTGDQIVEFEEYRGSVEDVDQLLLLNQQISTEIGRHVQTLIPGQVPIALPHRDKNDPMSYTLGSDAAKLKQATGADYAAFLVNRTSVESGGSVGTKILIGALTGYAPALSTFRGTYVSLVDLDTGEVVWLKSQAGGALSGADARKKEGTDRVVAKILDDGPFDGAGE